MKSFLILLAACTLWAQEEQKKYKLCPLEVEVCLETMANAYLHSAWDGLRVDGVGTSDPIRVVEVEPDSPGLKAGFKVGDVLIALDGVAMQEWSNQDLIRAMKQLNVGSEVVYTVGRGAETLSVNVIMASPPKDMVALWIGRHYLYNHYLPNRNEP